MARAGLWVCVFVAVLVCGVRGQVGSLCRSNERFLSCGGCQKTCQDPVPDCKAVCKEGCYCEEGEVRNATGHCVKLSECPPIATAYLHTSEPRSTTIECPEHEEYRFCEPCNRTCDNPNPVCPAQCTRGCMCLDGLVRNRDGRCVKVDECPSGNETTDRSEEDPTTSTATANPHRPSKQSCGPNQTYSPCQECESLCGSTHEICMSPCVAGCFCNPEFVKTSTGLCVKLEDCPRAAPSVGAHDIVVEDCKPDEIYFNCGWCEPSCWEPRPVCQGACVRGCLCRPPLLRHHSGQCVEERECAAMNCTDPNTEYGCRYGCEARCDTQTCDTRARRCNLDCHCKIGFFRDANGTCVPPAQCRNTTANNTETPDYDEDKENSTDYIELTTFMEMPDLRTPQDPLTLSKIGMETLNPEKSMFDMKHQALKSFKDMFDLKNKFFEGFEILPRFRSVEIRLPGDWKPVDFIPDSQAPKLDEVTADGTVYGDPPKIEETIIKNSDGSMLVADSNQAIPQRLINSYMKEMINAAMSRLLPVILLPDATNLTDNKQFW